MLASTRASWRRWRGPAWRPFVRLGAALAGVGEYALLQRMAQVAAGLRSSAHRTDAARGREGLLVARARRRRRGRRGSRWRHGVGARRTLTLTRLTRTAGCGKITSLQTRRAYRPNAATAIRRGAANRCMQSGRQRSSAAAASSCSPTRRRRPRSWGARPIPNLGVAVTRARPSRRWPSSRRRAPRGVFKRRALHLRILTGSRFSTCSPCSRVQRVRNPEWKELRQNARGARRSWARRGQNGELAEAMRAVLREVEGLTDAPGQRGRLDGGGEDGRHPNLQMPRPQRARARRLPAFVHARLACGVASKELRATVHDPRREPLPAAHTRARTARASAYRTRGSKAREPRAAAREERPTLPRRRVSARHAQGGRQAARRPTARCADWCALDHAAAQSAAGAAARAMPRRGRGRRLLRPRRRPTRRSSSAASRASLRRHQGPAARPHVPQSRAALSSGPRHRGAARRRRQGRRGRSPPVQRLHLRLWRVTP